MNIRNGFLEKVYENALAYKLRKQSINCEQQVPLKVYFEDEVELKTAENLDKIHFAQVKNYLKATHYRLGLLVNFGKTTLEFKRIIL